MKKYLMTVMKHLKQVKVVHHLPGRLRLYIPLLERLSADWRRYQSDLIEIIKLKEGITDIELSIISGRVLVHYDPDRMDEEQILQWFKNLAVTIYEDYAREPFVSKREILPFLKKVRAQSLLMLQEEGPAEESA